MNKFFHYLNHQNTAILGCVLALIGLIYGKFILSIGMLLLIFRAVFNPRIKIFFTRLLKHRDFLAIASVFFLFALSFFWSENTGYWLSCMKRKLPYIGMPVAFLAIERFDKKLFWQLMHLFFWGVSLTALGSLLFMLSDYQNVIDNYGKGQVISLPVHHIRFSLMVIFAICLGFEQKFRTFSSVPFLPKLKILVSIFTGFLILYIHLIAVRSGLLAFYGVSLFYLLRFFFSGKKKLLGVGLLFFFMTGSFLAYQYVPTLKKKVDYTWYSVNIFNKKKKMRDLSDSRRLGSILAGIELTKEHPLIGVGMGDIRDESNEWLKENYPDLKGLGLMPHNQFLWVTTAVGWLGFLWFMTAILFPLFYKKGWRDPLLVSFYIIIFSSFLVEHTLETQVGLALFIFPLMLILRARAEREISKE